MVVAILFGNIIALLWIYLHRKRIHHNQKIYKMLQQLPYHVLQGLRFLPPINIIFMAWLIFTSTRIHLNIAAKYFVYGGVAIIEYLIHLIHFSDKNFGVRYDLLYAVPARRLVYPD